MVDLNSSISFLVYITAVSSAAAGVTEAFKTIVPFLGTDYEAADSSLDNHNKAAWLNHYKKFLNILLSTVSAGVIIGLTKIDPGLILAGADRIYVENSWEEGIWVWGIVAVFGSPFFHSLLKILEGYKQTMNNGSIKPKQMVGNNKK